ncbi:hypothetical protein HDU97_010180 [Phlyctochytrium planicorne]|nr:hypothetical protein HDU97_010180 [Phlyctochytrium planicorne]
MSHETTNAPAVANTSSQNLSPTRSLASSQGDLSRRPSTSTVQKSKSLDTMSERFPPSIMSAQSSSKPSIADTRPQESQVGLDSKSIISKSTTISVAEEAKQQDDTASIKPPKRISQWAKGASLRVIQEFKATEDGELDLEMEEVIELEFSPASDDEYWLKGINRSLSDKNGQSGFFPASCVELETWDEAAALIAAQEQAEAARVREEPPAAEEEEEEEPFQRRSSVGTIGTVGTMDEQEIEIPKPVPPGTKVTCRLSYVREKADEIDLHQGDVVVVLESPEGGWWRGMTNLGGKEPRSGWFPATVIDVAKEKSAAAASATVQTESSAPTQQPHPPAVSPPSPSGERFDPRAAEDTGPQGPGDRRKSWYKRLVKKPSIKEEKESKKGRVRSLSAPGGSQLGSKSSINVLGNTEEFDEDGSEEAPLEPLPERLSTKSRNSVISPSGSTHSSTTAPPTSRHKRASSAPAFTLSIAIPHSSSPVAEITDVPNLVSPVSSLRWQDRLSPEDYESMTSQERKRMTAIWELIVTERDYVRDLKIIIDVFMRPMSENKFGNSKNLDALFSNVDELHAINSELLQKFEERLENEAVIECIGSIFLAMSDSFASYSLYLQRICKYPLLLKEILKHTEESHRDYTVLKEAMERLQGIIAQVNDGARAAEGVRKIVEIQTTFIEKINIVTPNRYLVREESLHLMVGDTKKPRRLFLFNDLMLIARKDWRDKLHLIEQANLRNCRVSDVAEDGDARNLFEIEILPAGSSASSSSPGKSKRFLFSASSKQAKMSWLDAYKSVAEASIRKKLLSETSIQDFDADPAASDEEDNDAPKRKKDDTVRLEMESSKKSAQEDAKKKREEEAKRLEETEKNLADITTKLNDALSKIEVSDAKNSELSTKLSESESALQSLKEKEESLSVNVATMEHKLSASYAKVTGLEHDLEKLKNERDAFSHKVEILTENTSKQQAAIQSLKIEIEKAEVKKTSLASAKDAEIDKIKKESFELIEQLKIAHKAEMAAAAADRNIERNGHLKELASVNADLQRAREEIEKRSKNILEESETRLSYLKKEAESKVIRLEQDYEIRFMKLQEESKSKIQSLEAAIQSSQLTFRTELEQKESALKLVEREKSTENHRIAKDFESFKQKAINSHENLKKAIAESQAHAKDFQQTLKEREATLRQKEDALREKDAQVAKLEAEKVINSGELLRISTVLESTKADHNRTVANLEKVIQERHQVLSRKETEISDLNHRLLQNMERANHATTELEKLRLEYNEKLRAADETISRLREELSNLKVEKTRDYEKLQSLEKSHKDLSLLFEQNKVHHATLTDANRKFASEHAKFKEALAKHAHNSDRLTKENAALHAQLSDLQERLGRKSVELSEIHQQDKSVRENLSQKEHDFNKAFLRAERAESKVIDLEKHIERLSAELRGEREAKNAEIHSLKDTIRKDADEGRGRLNQELTNLKDKLLADATERHEILIRENNELRQRLERESTELRERRSHEEEILRGRLELVERLEKETSQNRKRLEKENEDLMAKYDELESEFREKAKIASSFKRRMKELENENDILMGKVQTGNDRLEELAARYSTLEIENKNMEGELSLLRSRLSSAEKEMTALTHRMGLYNELDRKYLELREETIRISREAKSFEEEVKQSEIKDSKKSKDLAALMYVVEEITKSVYSISIASSALPEDMRVFGASTSISLFSHSITSSNLEDIRLLSLVRKVHELILAYERQKTELEVERAKTKDLDDACEAMRQERESNLGLIKKMEMKLKERSREQNEEIHSLREELHRLQKEFDLANGEKSKLEALYSEVSNRVRGNEAEKAQLDKRLMEAFDRIQKMSESHIKELSILTTSSSEKQKEVDDLRERLVDVSKKNEELQVSSRELEIDRNHLKNLNQSLLETKQKLQQLLENANEVGRNLGLDLNKTKQRLDELKDSDKQKDQAEEQTIEKLNEALRTQKQILEDREGRIIALERDLKYYVEETSFEFQRRGADAALAIRMAVESKENEIRQLRIELDQYRTKLQGLKAREDQFVMQTSRQSNDIKQLVFEKEAADKTLLQHQREVSVLKSKLEFMQRMFGSRDPLQAFGQPIIDFDTSNASPPLSHTHIVIDSDGQYDSIGQSLLSEQLIRYITTASQSSLTMIQGRLVGIVAKLETIERKLLAIIDSSRGQDGFEGARRESLQVSTSPSSPRSPEASPRLNSPDRESNVSTLFSPTTARGSLEYLVAAAAISGSSARRDSFLIEEVHRLRRDVIFSKSSVEETLKSYEKWVIDVEGDVAKLQASFLEAETLHNQQRASSLSPLPSPFLAHIAVRRLKEKTERNSPRVLIKGESEYNLADVFAVLEHGKRPRLPTDLGMSPELGLATSDCSFLLSEQPPLNFSETPMPHE